MPQITMDQGFLRSTELTYKLPTGPIHLGKGTYFDSPSLISILTKIPSKTTEASQNLIDVDEAL